MNTKASYNPFDPIQDTESYIAKECGYRCVCVTTHSIRYRILKDWQGEKDSLTPIRLQPIRSDTGY